MIKRDNELMVLAEGNLRRMIKRDNELMVWPKGTSDAAARSVRALSAKEAVEKRAREDWIGGQVDWPITYCVRDSANGTIWEIDVTFALHPAFVAIGTREIEMPAETHVLWGVRVLCEDLRLRGAPRDWPAGQCLMTLKDMAEGAEPPSARCEACWTRALELVEQLRQWRQSIKL